MISEYFSAARKNNIYDRVVDCLQFTGLCGQFFLILGEFIIANPPVRYQNITRKYVTEAGESAK